MGKVVKGIAGVAVNPLGTAVGAVAPGLGKAINPVGYAIQSKIIGRKPDGSAIYDSDASGRPELAAFQSQLDPTTGKFKQENYNLQNNLNTQGLEAMRTEALRDPSQMSKWGSMALAQGRDQNAQAVAGQNVQARNQLAMQGGLRTGARERLAAQSAQAQLAGNQNQLQNVQMQDEQNRMKWLQMLPQQEIAAAQYGSALEDKNISRYLGETEANRDWDKIRYQEQMKGYAADKSSTAMQRAAEEAKKTGGLFGGGGFLGTGI